MHPFQIESFEKENKKKYVKSNRKKEQSYNSVDVA